MTTPSFAAPQPQPQPPHAAQQAPKRPWYRKNRVLVPVALIIGAGIGASGNGNNNGKTSTAGSDAAAKPAATVTVSATATVTAQAPQQAAAPATPQQAAPPAVPQAAATTAQPQNTIGGDGTYEVGTDVQPGTYKTKGPGAMGLCYWERNNGGDGVGSIIANDNLQGPGVVTIKAGDKIFKSSGCQAWVKTG
ncbi:hypothetical protein ACPC54_36500 [Kitasatospora sp. NPDC094028]